MVIRAPDLISLMTDEHLNAFGCPVTDADTIRSKQGLGPSTQFKAVLESLQDLLQRRQAPHHQLLYSKGKFKRCITYDEILAVKDKEDKQMEEGVHQHPATTIELSQSHRVQLQPRDDFPEPSRRKLKCWYFTGFKFRKDMDFDVTRLSDL